LENNNTVMFTNKLEARENPPRNCYMAEYIKLGYDVEYFKRVLVLLLFSMEQSLCSLADGLTI